MRKWVKIGVVTGSVCLAGIPVDAASVLASWAVPGEAFPESRQDSFTPRISADGRYVVYFSVADDLTEDVPDRTIDIFRHDRQTGSTIQVNQLSFPPYGPKAPIQSFTTDSSASLVAYVQPTQEPWFNSVLATGIIADLATGQSVMFDEYPVDGTEGFIGTILDARLSENGEFLFFTTFNGAQPEDNALYSDFRYMDTATRTVVAVPQPKPTVAGEPAVEEMLLNANIEVSRDGRFAAYQYRAYGNDLISNRKRDEIMFFDRTTGSIVSLTGIPASDPDVDGNSRHPKISENGRWIVYQSTRTNLVANDGNGPLSDVFLHDRESSTTTLISTNLNGSSSVDAISGSTEISGDGQWTAFFSSASDLVSNDENDAVDVFVRDNLTGAVTKISNHTDWNGAAPRNSAQPIVSHDGEFVLYQSAASGLFLYQRSTDSNTLITTDVESDEPSMTPDAMLVAFSAKASTLNPQSSSPARNIYVWHRASLETELISRQHDVFAAPQPNADVWMYDRGVDASGNRFAFRSSAENLMPNQASMIEGLWYRDITLGTNFLVSIRDGSFRDSGPAPFGEAVMSGNGRWLAYLGQRTNLPPEGGELNGWNDVWLHDLQNRTSQPITSSRTGSFAGSSNSWELSISLDGSRIAFQSESTNLIETGTHNPGFYVWDRATSTIKPLDANPARCDRLKIQPSGNHASFITQGTPSHNLNVQSWDEPEATSLLTAEVVHDYEWNHSGTHLAAVSQDSIDGFIHVFDFRASPPTSKTQVIRRSPYPNGVAVDASGRFVAYFRFGENVIALMDMDTGTPILCPTPYQHDYRFPLARELQMSSDGRYIAYRGDRTESSSQYFNTELRTHLRLWDTVNNTVAILDRGISDDRFSFAAPGTLRLASSAPRILFNSLEADLSAGDINGHADVFVYSLVQADTDGDQLDDYWEMAYFNTLDRDGNGDFDEDGLSDFGEFKSGNIPINSGSVLAVTQIRKPGANEVVILWNSIPGRTYQVQHRNTAENSPWFNTLDTVTADSTTSQYIHSRVFGNEFPPSRFYRVVLVE